jgi:hypothetical protein
LAFGSGERYRQRIEFRVKFHHERFDIGKRLVKRQFVRQRFKFERWFF